jgi:hypothetical protein
MSFNKLKFEKNKNKNFNFRLSVLENSKEENDEQYN